MKRHNHNVTVGWKGDTPKALWDITRDEETQRITFRRKVDHVIGNGVYHPTKGWRKVRKNHGAALLNNLFSNIGLKLF